MKTKNIKFNQWSILFLQPVKVITGILVLALASCSKDSGPNRDSGPDLENNLPSVFDLIEVADGATNVDVNPSLSWQAATDPDGDTVVYDLYLDTNTNPTVLKQANITSTSAVLMDNLEVLTDYYWKVIAKDGNGGEVQSATFGFTTRDLGFRSTAETEDAAFPPRWGHTITAFDDKLWVIGGYDGTSYNDVWYSTDGKTWTEATSSAAFSPRWEHSTVVYDNKLWVIGGHDGDSTNDVWYSSDGVTWTEATGDAAFPKRHYHTTAAFDGKLWVIAGRDTGYYNDIWTSTDGVTWTVGAGAAAFSKRIQHTTAVFDNKLWVIGGLDGAIVNDVWYSDDGISWTEATPDADFPARGDHTTVSFANRLWVISGYKGGGASGYLNDVWYSTDGIDWTEASAAAPFSERTGHASAVFDNKLWVIGGTKEGIEKNDVWVMD